MSKKFLVNIDLNGNQLINTYANGLVVENASADGQVSIRSIQNSGGKGQLYYNTTSSGLHYYDGTAWKKVANTTDISAASAITITGTASAGNFYPIFTTASGTSASLYVDSLNNLTYNPSTDTLTVPTASATNINVAGTVTSGSFSGDGSALTSVTGGNVTGSVTSALTSASLTITNTASNGIFYPTFVTASGNRTVYAASTTFTYNASSGNLTATTFNGLTLTSNATGFSIAGGTTSKTLTINNTLTLSGTDSSTLNIGSGGTLGTAAFTDSTAYAASFNILAISKGGTNTNATPTQGGVTYGTGTAYAFTAAGTTGQVLTSNGTSAPTWSTASTSLYASSAANLSVTTTTTAGTYYPVFVTNNSTSVQAASVTGVLSINPSTGVISSSGASFLVDNSTTVSPLAASARNTTTATKNADIVLATSACAISSGNTPSGAAILISTTASGTGGGLARGGDITISTAATAGQTAGKITITSANTGNMDGISIGATTPSTASFSSASVNTFTTAGTTTLGATTLTSASTTSGSFVTASIGTGGLTSTAGTTTLGTTTLTSASTTSGSFVTASVGTGGLTSTAGTTTLGTANITTASIGTGGFTSSVGNTYLGSASLSSASLSGNIITAGNISASGNITVTGSVTSGSFGGNGAGLTSIQNASVTVTDTTGAGTYYPAFVSSSTGNNVIRTTAASLTYVPSTGTLNAPKLTASSIALFGSTSGSITLVPTAVASTASLTLPATTGTVALTSDIKDSTINLNASGGVLIGGASGANSFTLNQSGNSTFAITTNATSANTVSTIVQRDSSGNFSAGTITATSFSGPLSGNATTATTATNIAGGAAGQIHYQTGASTTGFISAPAAASSVLTASSTTGFTYTNYTAVNTANTLVYRDANARFQAADPSAAQDVATKNYVDSTAQGLNIHDAVKYATTTNLVAAYNNGTSGSGATLTASGAAASTVLVIDTASPSVNDRILVKSQTTQTQNGIYVVTSVGASNSNWILTRATDADNTPSGEITAGDFTFVTSGSLANTGWVQTTYNPVIGTDNVVYTQFSGAGAYTAASGVAASGTVFYFNPSTTGGLQTDALYASIKLATNSGLSTGANGLTVGTGTGLTTSGGSVQFNTGTTSQTNAGVATATWNYGVQKQVFSITASSASVSNIVTLTHNMNSKNVLVQIYENSTGNEIELDISRPSASTVTLTWATAAQMADCTAVIMG